jgi:hypothetical protein
MMHETQANSDPVYGPELEIADDLANELYYGKEIHFNSTTIENIVVVDRDDVIQHIEEDPDKDGLLAAALENAFTHNGEQANYNLFIEHATALINEAYYWNCQTIPVAKKAGTAKQLKKNNRALMAQFMGAVA